VAAPTDEERVQHYLWRFWRHIPRAGYATIFDRSWYGRVLVERVEGFAPVADWSRAYHEINEFEEQMSEHGIVVNKFWLHISQQEQLRRFKERQSVAYKQHKITDEDWRNRKQWPAYQAAVEDMVAHTSTDVAPWTLVSGNDKRFARIQILKTVVKRLEAALKAR
jgi:polyphosphate kinase 2 (PPK2 family)